MNAVDLQIFTQRWPNDKIIVRSMDIRRFREMIAQNVTESPYLKELELDPGDTDVLRQFAEQSGFRYDQHRPIAEYVHAGHNPAWLGTRTAATMPMFVHALTSTTRGYAVETFLEYAVSSTQKSNAGVGDEQHLDKRSIVAVTLPENYVFPQLLLDSNKNDRGITSTIPTTINRSQIVKLEGNFAEYYDFYVPKSLQIDALTVLAPNFMRLLIASSASFDVEFFGNKMYMVSKQNIYSPVGMQELMSALDAQLAYLAHLQSSWQYGHTSQTFDKLTYATFNGPLNFKIGPLRFGPRATLVLLLLGFILFGLIVVSMDSR